MSYSSEVLADSPKVYYRMQEASGLPQDSSGLAHHVTAATGTQVFAYHAGGPLATDASDYAIGWSGGSGGFSTPDHADLDLGDVMTAEAWIYRADLGVTRVITAKGVNALTWGIDAATGNLFIAKANVAVICLSSVAISTSTWTHVAYTKNGATNFVYINGADRTGTVTNQTLASTATAQFIGTDYDGTSYAWYGSLDEVALYATALSQARIQAHYNAAFTVVAGAGRGMTLTGVG